MQIELGTAILLLAGIVGVQVIGKVVDFFFDRMKGNDLITIKQCAACKIEKEVENKKIDAIAKLTLKMAIKMGIDTADIEKLL